MWVRTPTSRNTTISVIRIIKSLPPPLPKEKGVSFYNNSTKITNTYLDYLKSKGCKVSEDFSDYGNHVNYALFVQIGQTMLDMLPFMKNADEIVDLLGTEIVNKLTEYAEEMDDDPFSL